MRAGLPGGRVGVVAYDVGRAADPVLDLFGPVARRVVGERLPVRCRPAQHRRARRGRAGLRLLCPRLRQAAQVVVGEALRVRAGVGDPQDVARGVVGVAGVPVGPLDALAVHPGGVEPAGAVLVGVGQPGLLGAGGQLVLLRSAGQTVLGAGHVRAEVGTGGGGAAQLVVGVDDGLGRQAAGSGEAGRLQGAVQFVTGVEDVRARQAALRRRDGDRGADRPVQGVVGVDGLGVRPPVHRPGGARQHALADGVVRPGRDDRAGRRAVAGRGPAVEAVVGGEDRLAAGVGDGDGPVEVVVGRPGRAGVGVVGPDLPSAQVVVAGTGVARRVGDRGELPGRGDRCRWSCRSLRWVRRPGTGGAPRPGRGRRSAW